MSPFELGDGQVLDCLTPSLGRQNGAVGFGHEGGDEGDKKTSQEQISKVHKQVVSLQTVFVLVVESHADSVGDQELEMRMEKLNRRVFSASIRP